MTTFLQEVRSEFRSSPHTQPAKSLTSILPTYSGEEKIQIPKLPIFFISPSKTPNKTPPHSSLLYPPLTLSLPCQRRHFYHGHHLHPRAAAALAAAAAGGGRRRSFQPVPDHVRAGGHHVVQAGGPDPHRHPGDRGCRAAGGAAPPRCPGGGAKPRPRCRGRRSRRSSCTSGGAA